MKNSERKRAYIKSLEEKRDNMIAKISSLEAQIDEEKENLELRLEWENERCDDSEEM